MKEPENYPCGCGMENCGVYPCTYTLSPEEDYSTNWRTGADVTFEFKLWTREHQAGYVSLNTRAPGEPKKSSTSTCLLCPLKKDGGQPYGRPHWNTDTQGIRDLLGHLRELHSDRWVSVVTWSCAYESRNGNECGRLVRVEWDLEFDSPADGCGPPYCARHEGMVT